MCVAILFHQPQLIGSLPHLAAEELKTQRQGCLASFHNDLGVYDAIILETDAQIPIVHV